MDVIVLLILSSIFTSISCSECNDCRNELKIRKFPSNFVWGSATAAYQIEGAVKADGKGENIWDKFVHSGGKIDNNDTADVACDSYHKYKEDVKLLRDLGVKNYRFSISWSRIFPSGTNESYNTLGMQYYKNLSDELIRNGITPMATLYHWDLPQPLEDFGGFLNESLVEHFARYADVCFKELGEKVKYWITFNEPFVSCWKGYGTGERAPGRSNRAEYPYTCAHTVIKSHARAWHIYDSVYRQTQQGKISITLDIDWKEPKTDSALDRLASENALQFKLGWFAHPIIKGDYPQVMKYMVGRRSTVQGYNKSRLPEFTAEEVTKIKGTYDFLGINHYTTQLVSWANLSNLEPSYEHDQDLILSLDPNWKRAASKWLYDVPWGFRKLLVWIKNEYNNPSVMITENGVSDSTGDLDDQFRISYYTGYISNVLKAIEGGCNVTGYYAWSLLDNFEWARGYTEKFGLHFVNFSDPNRPRLPKASAKWFRDLVKDNGFPDKPNASPPRLSITIHLSLMSAAAIWCFD